MLVRTVLSPYELPDSSRSFLNLNEKPVKLGIRGAHCAELGPVKPALPLREPGVGRPIRRRLGQMRGTKGNGTELGFYAYQLTAGDADL